MTEQRIEELAEEVAREVGTKIDGFAIERVVNRPLALTIIISWREPFHTEVSIKLTEEATDESIKQEIHRQLENAVRSTATAGQGRRLSESQITTIVRLLATTDMSSAEIAQRMGCTKVAVVSINRKYSIRIYDLKRNRWQRAS